MSDNVIGRRNLDVCTGVVIAVVFSASGLAWWAWGLESGCVVLMALYVLQEMVDHHLTNFLLRSGDTLAAEQLVMRRIQHPSLIVRAADALIVAAAVFMLWRVVVG